MNFLRNFSALKRVVTLSLFSISIVSALPSFAQISEANVSPPNESAEPATAPGGLYIKVGEATLKKSNLALTPIQNLGSIEGAKNHPLVGRNLFNVITNDLGMSSYFTFIPQTAFTESSNAGLRPKPIDENGFSFDSWKTIGTEFLIKGGYRITGNKIKFEGYVYYVPKSQNVLAKSYEAPLSEIRKIAHKFSNDVVEKLTGRKGIFDTKLTVVRATNRFEKEVFVMDWDAANPEMISNHKTIAVSPSWTPNGRSIYYTAFVLHKKSKRRNADLFKFDLKTRQRDMVSYIPGLNSGVSFFPDGQKFVVRLSKQKNSDLYIMNPNGEIQKTLTNGPNGAMNVEPAVSPDGSKIAFSSDRSGKPMVYIMNADGTNPIRRTIAGKYNSSPAWSPDGKKIAFAGHDKGKFDIFTMNADGSGMVRLTSGGDNESPSFSPDGRLILFRSNRSKKWQLYITDTDGNNERQITFDKHDYFSPQWSPRLD